MTRPPLELLLEGWETRARQLNENSRTEEDAHLSWYYGGRAAELSDCIQALRAQVPAAAGDDALAREVHAAWRDGMLNQGREVASHRMTWDTLSPEDYALDAYIAQRVASAALRAQAEADKGLRAALDAAIQCEQDVVDAYGRGAPMVVLDEAVADLKRDSLPHLKRARAALAQADAGGEG